MIMSIKSVLFLSAIATVCTAFAEAWVVPSTTFTLTASSVVSSSSSSQSPRTDSITLNASRGAKKWGRKKAWLEKRGFPEQSESLDTSVSTTSSIVTIVGSGRIGGLLATGGDNVVVVGREDTVDPDTTGPIILTTRNDALDGLVEACPEHRRKDLVFVQNGYLDNFLESKGLLDNTQVLLYLSVTAKGADPIDGVTTVNPEGLTTATGEHAQAFADLLAALELKCNVVSGEDYRPAMFEKLIWISTYMLVGTAKECSSVGQAGADHKDTVEAVITELLAAVEAKEGIKFPDGAVQRLAAYTDVVTDFPCAVKEFEWRNQYFYNLGDEACPTHNGLLRECAEKGFLGFELP